MLNFKEEAKANITGELFIKMYRHDELIYEGKDTNLVVNNGLIILAGLLAGDFTNYEITQVGFGDGTTATDVNQQNLQGDYHRKKGIDSDKTTVFGANIAKIYWDITYGDDIGGQTFQGGVGGVWTDGDPFTIKEFGLFANNDDMFNRIVWSGPDLVMDTGIRLEGYFQIKVSKV